MVEDGGEVVLSPLKKMIFSSICVVMALVIYFHTAISIKNIISVSEMVGAAAQTIIIPTFGFGILLGGYLGVNAFLMYMTSFGVLIFGHRLGMLLWGGIILGYVIGVVWIGTAYATLDEAGYIHCKSPYSKQVTRTYAKSIDACVEAGFPRGLQERGR